MRTLALAPILILCALVTRPCAAQTLQELRERVVLAYEAQAQAWVARAEALQANAESYEARKQAWEQSILATIAWNDTFGEADSASVSEALEAASWAGEQALKARETAFRARELASAARELASHTRDFASVAQEASLRARNSAAVAREAASHARNSAVVAWEAASDAREMASQAEGKMIRARAYAIGQYATLWERVEVETGREHAIWIRAASVHNTVEEAFDEAAKALDAEAAAWDRVGAWMRTETREAADYVSLREDEWNWEIGFQYSPAVFYLFSDVSTFFPLGIAMTFEKVKNHYSFFVPISFHYINSDHLLRYNIDWYTVTFIGFGARYYISNGVYISASLGPEMSGDEEVLLYSNCFACLQTKFGGAFQAKIGWKIPSNKNYTLDISLAFRPRIYTSFPSRGFMLSVGISTL